MDTGGWFERQLGLSIIAIGYEGAATAWAADAELVYGPMADALPARAPELAGQLRSGTSSSSRSTVSSALRSPCQTGRVLRPGVVLLAART